MGSALPSEKLDRNNFASWEYKMHQYLVSQGYWSYIKGAQENQPGPTTPKYSAWKQAASRVTYSLTTCAQDHMLNTPKEAWENLRKIFTVSTTVKKLLSVPWGNIFDMPTTYWYQGKCDVKTCTQRRR